MNNIILKKLYIDQFCKIKNKTIDFDRYYNIIKGKNGLGKTTIANTITFLLLKKSVLNTSVQWTPILKDGTYNESALCQIILDLEKNGTPFKVSMIRQQKGKTFDFIYKINETEFKWGDYQKEINKLFGFEDEEMFLASFNINYMLSQGDTKSRKIAMKFYEVSRIEIVGKQKFSDAFKERILQDNTLDTIEKNIKGSIKLCEQAVALENAKLSEQESTLEAIGTANVVVDKEAIEKQILEKEAELLKLDAEAQVYEENKLEGNQLNFKLARLQNELGVFNNTWQVLEESRLAKIEAYSTIKFKTTEKCENCKDRLKELDKETLDIIAKKNEAQVSIDNTEKEIKETNIKLSEWKELEKPQEVWELKDQIAGLKQSLKDDANSIKVIKDRIEEIKLTRKVEQEKLTHIKGIENEFKLFLEEQSKVIQEGINKNLPQGYEIRLFKLNKSKVLKPVFEVLFDKIPYGQLSTAQQIRSKIVMAKKLQERMEVNLPMIVDCHESLDSNIETNSQVVALEVDKTKEELEIVKGK